ncbi:MAG: hypothetical protein ACXW27_07680 [Allosphingosinicella sp.]
MRPVRQLLLLTFLLLGACSLRGTIDAVTPEADRAFAGEMVSRLRSGDRAWLQRHFEPGLWAQSGEQLSAAPPLFPTETGTTELVGFNISTNMSGGRTERMKEFTLVTHGGGRWTVTAFATYSTGGPDRVTQWSVVPHSTIPPELAMIEAMDRALPWVWAWLAIFLVGGGGLIVWLVRRSRRKHDPWVGRSGARP